MDGLCSIACKIDEYLRVYDEPVDGFEGVLSSDNQGSMHVLAGL